MLNWQLPTRITHQAGVKLGAHANVCFSISNIRNWGEIAYVAYVT